MNASQRLKSGDRLAPAIETVTEHSNADSDAIPPAPEISDVRPAMTSLEWSRARLDYASMLLKRIKFVIAASRHNSLASCHLYSDSFAVTGAELQ